MGMRKYFNQLSLSLVRIRNTKLAMANKYQEKEVKERIKKIQDSSRSSQTLS